MAVQSISTLKNWFKRGLKPLQQQFWDWMDSYWHKSEKLPIASVDGLTEILNSIGSGGGGESGEVLAYVYGEKLTVNGPAATYPIEAGKLLEKLVIKPAAATAFKIGTASGLDDIVPTMDLVATAQVFTLDMPGDCTLHLAFTGSATLIFYKRPLNL